MPTPKPNVPKSISHPHEQFVPPPQVSWALGVENLGVQPHMPDLVPDTLQEVDVEALLTQDDNVN